MVSSPSHEITLLFAHLFLFYVFPLYLLHVNKLKIFFLYVIQLFGSTEVAQAKGTEIVREAIKKVRVKD